MAGTIAGHLLCPGVVLHAVSLLLVTNTPEVTESINPGGDHPAVDPGPEISSGLGMILIPIGLPAGPCCP